MNSRPFLTALHVAGTAFALLALAAPAEADIGDGSVKCTDSYAADIGLNPSYVDCTAHFENGPQVAPETTLVEPFGPKYGDFAFIGQTTSALASGGPFQPFGPNVEFGTLVLKAPQLGSFVIALGSNGDYSFYLYDASSFTGGVTSIDISTIGTTGNLGSFPLDYANLYAPVPEPASVALMLAGLAATGFALRRRKS